MTPALESRPAGPSPWRWLAGGLALAFGAATLVEGGHTLFGGPAARAEAGEVVPFVLAFNFVAGLGYLAAGGATLAGRAWAVWAARGLAAATLTVFAAFGAVVALGSPFERRTVVAMTVRALFWVAQALVLPGLLRRR